MGSTVQIQGVTPNINSFLWVLETSTRPNAVHLPTVTQYAPLHNNTALSLPHHV